MGLQQVKDIAVGKEAFICIEANAVDVCIRFRGNIHLEVSGDELATRIDELHNQILTAGLKFVVLDFTRLLSLHSGGIKAFANWVIRLENLSEERKYRVRILYNNQVPWQEENLPVLQELEPELVELGPTLPASNPRNMQL